MGLRGLRVPLRFPFQIPAERAEPLLQQAYELSQRLDPPRNRGSARNTYALLLERRGPRTVLIATAGFTDLLETARQDRPSLYRLCEDRPAPLAPSQCSSGGGGVRRPLHPGPGAWRASAWPP